MNHLQDFKLKGATVLLRSDLNSDVKNGTVILGPRIKEAARTIQLLKRKKARVIVIAHQGNKGKKDFISLKGHARHLNNITKTRFVTDICGKQALNAIETLQEGEALLLENLRFHKDEIESPKKHNELLETLGILADLYVNDAFSVSHRDHTSITGFPRVLPSCPGPLLEAELTALEKLRVKHALFILGGGKPEANMNLLKRKESKILAAGYFGQIILLSRGKKLGYQDKYLQKNALVKQRWKSFLQIVKKKTKNVVTPIDFALNISGKRVEKTLEDFPQPKQIDDIGSKTITLFKKEIAEAKMIYMKGPLGYTTNKTFAKGTKEILQAIRKAKTFSIVGGGHLSEAIEKYNIPRKGFGHISLSGGALAHWIAGNKLPGIEALKKNKK